MDSNQNKKIEDKKKMQTIFNSLLSAGLWIVNCKWMQGCSSSAYNPRCRLYRIVVGWSQKKAEKAHSWIFRFPFPIML